ncbi:hypothetical protein [Cytobacillus praedii]|uniref:hypothetical protein n=1 Tax=Cytobacillus praedii TaxID=1742358 RepID=UPI002E1C1173|nr:hypothetical protein [Cytobacillus praedii]
MNILSPAMFLFYVNDKYGGQIIIFANDNFYLQSKRLFEAIGLYFGHYQLFCGIPMSFALTSFFLRPTKLYL